MRPRPTEYVIEGGVTVELSALVIARMIVAAGVEPEAAGETANMILEYIIAKLQQAKPDPMRRRQ